MNNKLVEYEEIGTMPTMKRILEKKLQEFRKEANYVHRQRQNTKKWLDIE